jgi:hypothetical protein
MLTLYHGSGSGAFRIGPALIDKDEWNKLKSGAEKLLIVRRFPRAADVLTKYPFRIFLGENDFGDEFSVIYAKVALPAYVELEEIHHAIGGRDIFGTIAKTITELGHYIRFVAVDLALDDAPDPVANPNPAFTTDVVERALIDAELLLSSSGPPSAVDRVHTALSRLFSRTLCSPQRDYASDISTGYYGTFQGPADNRDIHSINSQPARRKGHTRSGSRH